MIYKVNGKLAEKDPLFAIVNIGGIFLEIHITLNTYSKLPLINSDVDFLTHLIVREDGFTLYGFLDLEEKSLFLKLTKVSKIGPKLAVALLSGVDPCKLRNAIIHNEIAILSSIPGIGKKTAERIVLELKDKLETDVLYDTEDKPQVFDDVISALVNLGYKKIECLNAIKKVPEDTKDFEKILKYCLKLISKK